MEKAEIMMEKLSLAQHSLSSATFKPGEEEAGSDGEVEADPLNIADEDQHFEGAYEREMADLRDMREDDNTGEHGQ
jgi:hypothetical protein